MSRKDHAALESSINDRVKELFLNLPGGRESFYCNSLKSNPDVLFGSLWFRRGSNIEGYGLKFDSHLDFCPSTSLKDTSKLIRYLQAPIVGINLRKGFYSPLFDFVDLPDIMKVDVRAVMSLMDLREIN